MPHFETTAAHGAASAEYEGAISFPIFQTATYSGSERYSYSRCSNPTRTELEQTVAGLEEGSYGFAFSSGLAAISAVLCLPENGDTVLVSDDLYGGTYRLIETVWKRFGIRFHFADLQNPVVPAGTRMVLLETPTNPMMKLLPIREIAQATKQAGALLVVDNTFLTPYYQKPLTLGADIVVHSGTKFLSGHHDTSCGIVVVKDSALAEKLAHLQRTLGNALSPFDSWLTLRGLQTLPIRMEQHSKTALTAARFLASHPRIERVFYPGLPSHPQYGLLQRQATGAGGVLSFLLVDDDVRSVLHSGTYIRFAESLGGTTSLITHPQTQTHASVPDAIRRRIGITPRLLRLSVGLEHEEDLLADLASMLREGQQRMI